MAFLKQLQILENNIEKFKELYENEKIDYEKVEELVKYFHAHKVTNIIIPSSISNSLLSSLKKLTKNIFNVIRDEDNPNIFMSDKNVVLAYGYFCPIDTKECYMINF